MLEQKTRVSKIAWVVLRYTASLLLVLAAGIKLYEIVSSPIWEDSALLPPFLHVLASLTELILGIWLLSGIWRYLLWWCSFVFFLVLSAVSFSMVLSGAADCGCFGALAVSPYLTFGIDLILVVMHGLAFRYCCGDSTFQMPGGSVLGHFATVVCVMMFVSFLYGTETGKSVNSFASSQSGLIRVVDDPIDVGRGNLGEEFNVDFIIENKSASEVRIVGRGVACRCIEILELPEVIPPKSQAIGKLNFTILRNPTPDISKRFVIYVEHPLQDRLVGVVNAFCPQISGE